MIALHDLLEPEETVGNLWHDWAIRWGAAPADAEAAVTFEAVRSSAATLYRALGGHEGTEIVAAPAATSGHRLGRLRRIGTPREMVHVADFTGERLRLPPVMDAFPSRELNRAAYLWLAALAAFVDLPEAAADPYMRDLLEIGAISAAADLAYRACPGLRTVYAEMCAHLLHLRSRDGLPRHEAAVENLILDQLGGGHGPGVLLGGPAPRGYRTYAPVPIWLRLLAPAPGRAPRGGDAGSAPSLPTRLRKNARRENRDEASRKDSFIVHRFESIMSWAESLDINRMTDDDDQENAQKAAEDQDHITLSDHVRRAASRLRLSLDLSPQDAAHERLAGRFTYPEWNHRSRAYMPGHARVLEAEATPGEGFCPDPRLVARVPSASGRTRSGPRRRWRAIPTTPERRSSRCSSPTASPIASPQPTWIPTTSIMRRDTSASTCRRACSRNMPSSAATTATTSLPSTSTTRCAGCAGRWLRARRRAGATVRVMIPT